mmetsp:Transcript_46309/g.76987  ORF Transcript_46309/g.76987 Transcript_46309/m.76987 type:complete len:410 (+) Transcript_46309:969-2198(+)
MSGRRSRRRWIQQYLIDGCVLPIPIPYSAEKLNLRRTRQIIECLHGHLLRVNGESHKSALIAIHIFQRLVAGIQLSVDINERVATIVPSATADMMQVVSVRGVVLDELHHMIVAKNVRVHVVLQQQRIELIDQLSGGSMMSVRINRRMSADQLKRRIRGGQSVAQPLPMNVCFGGVGWIAIVIARRRHSATQNVCIQRHKQELNLALLAKVPRFRVIQRGKVPPLAVFAILNLAGDIEAIVVIAGGKKPWKVENVCVIIYILKRVHKSWIKLISHSRIVNIVSERNKSGNIIQRSDRGQHCCSRHLVRCIIWCTILATNITDNDDMRFVCIVLRVHINQVLRSIRIVEQCTFHCDIVEITEVTSTAAVAIVVQFQMQHIGVLGMLRIERNRHHILQARHIAIAPCHRPQ